MQNIIFALNPNASRAKVDAFPTEHVVAVHYPRNTTLSEVDLENFKGLFKCNNLRPYEYAGGEIRLRVEDGSNESYIIQQGYYYYLPISEVIHPSPGSRPMCLDAGAFDLTFSPVIENEDIVKNIMKGMSDPTIGRDSALPKILLKQLDEMRSGPHQIQSLYDELIPAHSFLEQAATTLKERAAMRDIEGGERSMERIVKTFNALTGYNLSTAEGWEFMVLLKMVRSRSGKFHEDDFIDMASYSSLLGEERSGERIPQ